MVNRLGITVADRYRTVSEAGLLDMLLLAGWAFELPEGRDHAVAQTRAAIERWIALGLGFSGQAGARRFDPVEVVNFLIRAGRAGQDPFWAEQYVRTGRRLAASAATGETQAVRLHLKRRFNLRQFEPGTKLRLRLPVPLACAYVSEIKITPVLDASLAAEMNIGNGRMEVRLAAPGGEVEIGAELQFQAHHAASRAAGLDQAAREVYLRPAEGLVRVSPRVRALAARLQQAAPLQTLRAFWDHLLDGFHCGAIHYDQLPADACGWVLDHGWYDCQLASALLVALCRACGIPARIVSGHLLYPLAPTNHYWAEAWVEDRWLPFDFLSWGLSLGGTDPAWRGHFFGRLDFRMVTQILPLAFIGPMSLRLPPAWHMLQTGNKAGIEISFRGLDGGLIYADNVSLR